MIACISNKYEESRAKICIISHESCPCGAVYSTHSCLRGEKKVIAGLYYLLLPAILLLPPPHKYDDSYGRMHTS